MAEMTSSQQKEETQTPIKLISECYVRPKYEVEAAKNPYYLTSIELLSLIIDPIQKGLLYTLDHIDSINRTKIVCNLLDRLKNSLSIALVHFYPLAGRFATQKYPDEQASLIFLDCLEGPGARFIHATALDFSVSDIISSTDVPTIVQSFFELGEKSVNFDGHTRALLSIQVTELVDGVFIGFTINHSVVDGTSFIHFVTMLSEIFRFVDHNNVNGDGLATTISRVPVFSYNPWIKDRVIKVPHLEPEKLIEHGYEPGPLRERIFHFSRTSMATLKAQANQEYGTHNNEISSFQALVALVWRSITRARSLSSGQITACSLVVNARSRFDPPISDDYFGTFIGEAKCVCNVEELLGHDLGWAAMNLHKVIGILDDKSIKGAFKGMLDSPMILSRDAVAEFHGPNNVIVGGSARFDMYGPEFGLGRAVAARMGYPNKSDAKVTANPGCEGRGSVDLEICLRPHFMVALEADSEFMSHVSLCSEI